jgi:hypothetical protein
MPGQLHIPAINSLQSGNLPGWPLNARVRMGVYFGFMSTTISAAPKTNAVQAHSPAPAKQASVGDYVSAAAGKVLGQIGMGDLAAKLQAGPPNLTTALKSHDYSGVEWAFRSMDKPARLAKLEELRAKDPAGYKALLQDIRDGKIKDSEVTIPAGIDRLRSTRWAAGAEGKEVTAQVVAQYEKSAKDPWAADSRVAVGNVDGESAKTQADHPGPQAGRNGNKAETSILLDHSLTGNPEVLAATLAHEGQHSLRNAKGTLKNELAEETDAYTNQSAVWKEFGAERLQSSNPATQKAAQELEADATHYVPGNQNPMTAYVAGVYAQGHINLYNGKDGGVQDLRAANEVLNDYLAANDSSGGKLFQETGADSARSILKAAGDLSQYSGNSAKYMKRFQGLNQD